MMSDNQPTGEATMNKIDSIENVKQEFNSMIQRLPNGELDDHSFDEDFWTLIAPLKAGELPIGHEDEMCGECGKLKATETTRSIAQERVRYYLMMTKEMSHYEGIESLVVPGATSSCWWQMNMYATKRINDLVQSGAVTEELWLEMADRILEVY
jgi:hypothetical protein